MSSLGKPSSVLFAGMPKWGSDGVGIPPGISPVRVNVQLCLFSLQTWMSGSAYPAMIAQVMTTRAFLAVQMNQTILSTIFRFLSPSLFIVLWMLLLHVWPSIGLNHGVRLRALRQRRKMAQEIPSKASCHLHVWMLLTMST